MASYVFDIETNGFNATKIWCGVFKDISDGKVTVCTDNASLASIVCSAETLIGHNIVDFDLPVIADILGIQFNGTLYDTYLMSMLLDPDRLKHPECPKDKGAHSLANWGCVFGRYKPEHEEWDKFSPEMLHRCSEDVEINYLVWEKLSKEMGIGILN